MKAVYALSPRAVRMAGAVLAIWIAGTSVVAGKPPLREVQSINDGLFNVAVANEIRKACDDISARPIKALSVLHDLNRQALDMGYTQDEIDAFTDSDVEKDRMRARGAAFYAARGIDPADPQDLCALGRAEIEKSSQIGVLLRAK